MHNCGILVFIFFLVNQNTLFPLYVVHSLSISKTITNAPIKRVGIVGTGIAGLSLAHALENIKTQQTTTPDETPSMEISLFDSRPSLNFQDGAGVQINGGMSVFHKINPKLQASVTNAALPLKTIRSRTQPWFPLSLLSSSNENEDEKKNKEFATLLKFDIKRIIQDAGGDTEKELIVDGNAMSYTIMRGALQQVLLKELSPSTTERIQFGKKVTDIAPYTKDDEEGILCTFDDGSTAGPFDLVVGCDGIQSNVKEYVNKGKISKQSGNENEKNAFSSIYSGIRILFAVKDGESSTPDEQIPKSAELRQNFGDGGYGLIGTYGAGPNRVPSQTAFYIFRDENYFGPFRKKNAEQKAETTTEISENADWTQNVQSTKRDPRADFLERMQKSSMPSSELIPVVENADRYFELGVYFHNPLSLNGWKREVKGSGGKYCVLAGDAAHAMPPFLGQGANQAIQDAYCLASKISEYNENLNVLSTNESQEDVIKPIQKYIKDYENQRWKPTADIILKAAFLGYLEIGGGFLSKFRDAFFFIMGKIGVAKKIYLDGATPKV